MDDELRVGLRVTPDFTGFAKAVQQGAEKAMPSGIAIPVGISTDVAAIRKAAEDIQRALQQSVQIAPDVSGLAQNVQRELKNAVPTTGIEVPVEIAADIAAIRKVAEDVQKVLQQTVQIVPDVSGLAQDVQRALNSATTTDGITVPVQPTVDTKAVQQATEDAIRQTERVEEAQQDVSDATKTREHTEAEIKNAQDKQIENAERLEKIYLRIALNSGNQVRLIDDEYAARKLEAENEKLQSEFGLQAPDPSEKYQQQLNVVANDAIAAAQRLQSEYADSPYIDLTNLKDAMRSVGTAATLSADDVRNLNVAIADVNSQIKTLSDANRGIAGQARLQSNIQKARADLEDIGRRWGALFTNDSLKSQYNRLMGRLTDDISAEELTTIRTEMRAFNAEVKAAGLNAQTLGQRWQNALSKFTEWFGVANIVMGAVAGVKTMVQNVKDLDAAVTDLQIASGQSRDQVWGMVRDYADMGAELGAVATDVAAAADTFLRQGQSMANTNELIRDSMMLSRLGQIDAAEASTALTSAMKGYQVEAEEAVRIVDRLTAVDMAAAADAGSLAVAMSETANSARIAGIEMDRLIGYLAVVQEVTQDAPESVGTFFRTLMSRMGNIKAGRLIDPETNEDLSDVEATLSGADIALRSADDAFRNFGGVLDEVASKWDSFSNVQQRAIATAFAGTMQQERFLVLMENYGTAMEYMDIAADSAGTASEKYEAYLDSIEAKSQKFQAQFQKLSASIVNSDLVSFTYDAGTGILGFLDAVISKIGVMPVAGGVGGIAAFVKYIRDLKDAMDSIGAMPDINLNSAQSVGASLAGMTKAQQVVLQNISSLNAAGIKQAQTWAEMVRQGQLVTTNSVMQSAAIQMLTQAEQDKVKAAIQSNSVDKEGVLISREKVQATVQEALVGKQNAAVVAKETAQTVANNVQKQRSTKLTLAQVAANLKLMAANPLTWISLIPAAVSAVVQIVDACTVSLEEQIEIVDEAKAAYDETSNEIEELNTQLESNIERYEELNALKAQGDISTTESAELERLRSENAELERNIELRKSRQALQLQDYELEFDQLYDKITADTWTGAPTTVKSFMGSYSPEGLLKNAQHDLDYWTGWMGSWMSPEEVRQQDTNRIEAAERLIKENNVKLVEAIEQQNLELQDQLIEDNSVLEQVIAASQSNIAELEHTLEPYYDSIFGQYDYDVTKMPDRVAEQFQYVQALQNQVLSFDSSNIDRIADSINELVLENDALPDDVQESVDKIRELADTGEITEEKLAGIEFDPLRNWLHTIGFTIEDLINSMQYLQTEAAKTEESLNSVAPATPTPIQNYVARNQPVYDVNAAQDALGSALDEYNESGAVTEDTLTALETAIPGVTTALLNADGTWTAAGLTVMKYSDNVQEATRAMYEAMIAQQQMKLQNLDPSSKTYDTDYSTIVGNIDSLRSQVDAMMGDVGERINEAIRDVVEESGGVLQQALTDLQSGDYLTWSDDFIREILDAAPELTGVLKDLADGAIDSRAAYIEFQDALGEDDSQNVIDALSELNSAMEQYSEDSIQVRDALNQLGSVVPGLNGLLYDETGAYTTVAQAALLAATGNREAAIQMIDAAIAAQRADMSNLVSQYQSVGNAALDAGLKMAMQAAMAEDSDVIQRLEHVKAAFSDISFDFGGAVSSGGGGGSGSGSSAAEEDVLEAYKRDQDILEHRIEMSEAAQNLAEEDTEAWKKEQQNQLNIYLEYADRIKDEMERLRELGYDDDSEEMNQLESDLADVYQNIYEIQKDAWEKARDARIDAIEDELEAAEKAHDAEIEMFEAYINRYEALIGLLKEQHELSTSIRDERTELNRELSKAQSYVGLTEDERAELFSDADYNQLMGVLDDLQAESIAMYNEYVNQINAVNVEEAYKLDYITAEYQAQYDLMAKKYEIAKQDLALARARIALENAQNNRNVAMLVNGRWTWQADPEAVQSAMDTMYDAENAANNAQMELSYQQQLSQLEIWKAQVELEREAAEAAFEAIREALENEIELLEEQEFIMEDQNMAMGISVENMYGFASGVESAGNALASATSSAVSAVNAAAASAASSISSMMSELSDYSQKTAKDSSYDNRPYDGLRRASSSGSSSSSSSSSGKTSYRGSGGNRFEMFAEGGVMAHTGPAILHGSKSAPEIVFNSADAAKLYDLIHNGDYMQTMFKNLMANLRASMATVSPATPTQTAPVQYIVNGLTFGPESSGLTLGELANKLTSAAPFLK